MYSSMPWQTLGRMVREKRLYQDMLDEQRHNELAEIDRRDRVWLHGVLIPHEMTVALMESHYVNHSR